MGEISFIPEVLLLNILSRLAVKDAIRLRTICKDWNFLLREPKFYSLQWLQKRHENRFGCSSFFLIRLAPPIAPLRRVDMLLTFLSLEKTETAIVPKVDRELSVKTILPSFFVEPYWSVHNIQVFCPFDGLICFGDQCNVVMYNPATRELQKLPLSSAPFRCLEPRDIFQTCLLGVWLESTMKQHYKVFRIVYWVNRCKIEILDSITNCWTSTNTIFGRIHRRVYLLFNNVVHFYMQKEDLNFRDVIVTLDAISETFGLLELPPLKHYGDQIFLLPLRGSLALLDPDYKTHECSIWVMTEYGDEQSWTVQYWVSFIGPPTWEYYDFIFQPLSFWDCVDGTIELLAKSWDGKLVSCNLDNQKITDLGLYCDPYFASILPNKVETLLSFLSLKDL